MSDFFLICKLLGSIYTDYKSAPQFAEFIKSNDIGMPLAYFYDCELAVPIDEGIDYVNDTWDALVNHLGIPNIEYESVEEIIDAIPT